MQYWTTRHVQRMLGGSWLLSAGASKGRLGSYIDGVSIDSRTLQPGQIFVAIKGPQNDGHRHLAQAVQAGASMLIVSDPDSVNDLQNIPGAAEVPALQVIDTTAALASLARAWRQLLRRCGCKVIALTGSNGKTTTRNMIHSILSGAAGDSGASDCRALRGTQSPKSFNNHFGVPLSLLAADPAHDFVVCEIGTNSPGEVAFLADIVRPDLAVVTSVGVEHIEFFSSIENIAREEVSVARFVEPLGTIFLPTDNRLNIVKEFLPRRVSAQRIKQPNNIRATATGSTFNIDSHDFDLSLHGRHNVSNAALALAVAKAMGMEPAAAAKGLAKVRAVEGRLQPLRLPGDVMLINDAYNANPASVIAALDVLGSFDPGFTVSRRVAVLGDMLELGDDATQYHQQIGQDIVRRNGTGADLVITIGPLAATIASTLADADQWHGTVHRFDTDSKQLPAEVAALLQPSDVVLLKASRGVGLERVIGAVEARFGESLSAAPLPAAPIAATVSAA